MLHRALLFFNYSPSLSGFGAKGVFLGTNRWETIPWVYDSVSHTMSHELTQKLSRSLMNEIYKLAGESALVPCLCSDKEIQWTSYKSSGNYGKKGKRECRPFFSIMENINKIPFFWGGGGFKKNWLCSEVKFLWFHKITIHGFNTIHSNFKTACFQGVRMGEGCKLVLIVT